MDDCGTPYALKAFRDGMPRSVAVLARWFARKAVIEQLRARGLKPTPAVMRDLTEAYLRQHWRSLVSQAQIILKEAQQ
jgi:hypothetical protein